MKKNINHNLHIVMSMFHKNTAFANPIEFEKIPTQQTYGPFCFVRSLAIFRIGNTPFCICSYTNLILLISEAHLKVLWFSLMQKIFLPQWYFTLVLSLSLFLWYIFRSTNYVIIQCSGEIRGHLVVSSLKSSWLDGG